MVQAVSAWAETQHRLLMLPAGLRQVRLQSECVRHEDLVENTTSWLRDFHARFNLRTRPGFPIEVRTPFLACTRLPLPMTACRFACTQLHWQCARQKLAPSQTDVQALTLTESMRQGFQGRGSP